MAVPLAQSYAYCYTAFADVCDRVADGTAYHDNLLEEFDKYTLWAGNVGAAHSGKTYQLSLDYRLREAPFYKDQVSKLLEILTHQLSKTADILDGTRIPFEKLPPDSDSESSDKDSKHSNLEEDSPWEISSDSQDESPAGLISEDSAEGNPSLKGVPGSLTQPNATKTAVSNTTELGQLLESIRVTVTCLYKLPLRRPASVDRLGDQTTEDVRFFQPFDLMYIRDKFPRLQREVAVRFAKVITRRRQLLLYRKRHRDKLRTEATAPAPQSITPDQHSNEPVQQQIQGARETETGAPSQRESNRNTIKTKATTFKMDGLPQVSTDDLLAPSVAESDSKTSIVASEATRDINIQVPPRPLAPDGLPMARFECKYCCLTIHVRSGKAWKKHVLDDLQPYVCTYPDCSQSNNPFQSQDAWHRHEDQLHRFEFSCNNPKHPSFSFASDFDVHLKEKHQEIPGATGVPLDLFKQPQPRSGTCNLCFRKSENLRRHVARHLQQIALFAIPRADFGLDDEDMEDGDSDAAKNLTERSQSLGPEENSREESDESSISSHHGLTDALYPLSDPGQRSTAGDELQQSQIPDTDEIDWDSLTMKLSMARDSIANTDPIIRDLEEREIKRKEMEEMRKKAIREEKERAEHEEAAKKAATEEYERKRREKQAAAAVERKRIIEEFERKKIDDFKKKKEEEDALRARLKKQDEEKAAEEKREWEEFERLRMEREEKAKADKKKQDEENAAEEKREWEEFERLRMEREEKAKADKKKREDELEADMRKRLAPGNNPQHHEPIYVKVHCDHLAIETLTYHRLPWEWDRTDTNYIIILHEMDDREMDILFEHTKRLKEEAYQPKLRLPPHHQKPTYTKFHRDHLALKRLRTMAYRGTIASTPYTLSSSAE